MISAIRTAPTPVPTPPVPPGPPTSQTDDLYTQADSLIVALAPALAADPTMADSIKKTSADLKAAFQDQLAGTTTIPTLAENGRQAALGALAAGMMAGALDGLVLLTASQAGPPAPSPAPAPAPPSNAAISGDDIKKYLDKLYQELQQNLEAAKEELKTMGKEALQQASASGKEMGSQLVDNAGRFADHPKTPVRVYQMYLASTFAAGYALGVTDAAIVAVYGQTPGQQSQP